MNYKILRCKPGGRLRTPSTPGPKEPLSFLDALNHLLNFVLPAFGVGALAAALAKLAWRRELRGVRWLRLALWAGGAGMLASLGALLLFGRDGTMAAYGAMVLASALALWWAGFARAKRSSGNSRPG